MGFFTKGLSFDVGHYGSTGYILVINELNGGSSCEVVLYNVTKLFNNKNR